MPSVFANYTGTNGLNAHRPTPYGRAYGLQRHYPPSTGGALDGVKEFLDKETIPGVKNKYILAGAVTAGVLFYVGKSQRWF